MALRGGSDITRYDCLQLHKGNGKLLSSPRNKFLFFSLEGVSQCKVPYILSYFSSLSLKSVKFSFSRVSLSSKFSLLK